MCRRLLTLTPPPDHMVSQALQQLAERTGGGAWRSNDLAGVLARVISQDDGYYLIGYEPPRGTFDGDRPQYRRVTARVARKDVVVRTRSGFYNVTDDRLRALAQ